VSTFAGCGGASLSSADRKVCKNGVTAADIASNYLNRTGGVTGSAIASHAVADAYEASKKPGVSGKLAALARKAKRADGRAGGSNIEYYLDAGREILAVGIYCEDHGYKR